MQEYDRREWIDKGKELFGENYDDWRFVCPQCGNVATGKQFRALILDLNKMYCECIGRHVKDKGCDYAAYGLFDICKVHVDGEPVFEFAE